ncbi:MAG TPA: GH25 family lysozyme [Methyloceanibacter sp.]|jgi:lysozyme|nr:GH25 family lysozyme [Methyloceanibacter sp.]
MTSLGRLLAVIAATSALIALSGADHHALSRSLRDAKPHNGVAAAHTMPIQGIDVSYWQGDIDWTAAREAGVHFAFIKATEGGDHLDPKFLDNWNAAKRAGIARGAYHFIYWCRPANEQALWFMLNVPADSDALPPVLDLEWNSHSKTCPGKVDRELALKKIKIMLDAMHAHTGKRPIIYTDPKFHREILEGEFTDYHFWLRSVAAEPEVVYRQRPWSFWQFTTTGTVPGVKGKVDRNIYNGSRADWDRVLKWLQAGN